MLDAETAELYMSFYICHVSNFITLLLQTEELGRGIQGGEKLLTPCGNKKNGRRVSRDEDSVASFQNLPSPYPTGYHIWSWAVRFLFTFCFLWSVCNLISDKICGSLKFLQIIQTESAIMYQADVSWFRIDHWLVYFVTN